MKKSFGSPDPNTFLSAIAILSYILGLLNEKGVTATGVTWLYFIWFPVLVSPTFWRNRLIYKMKINMIPIFLSDIGILYTRKYSPQAI